MYSYNILCLCIHLHVNVKLLSFTVYMLAGTLYNKVDYYVPFKIKNDVCSSDIVDGIHSSQNVQHEIYYDEK